MAKWEKVSTTDEVPLGTVKGFKINNKSIIVAHTADGYYALDGICSHKGGDLAKGKLKEKTIYCPVHGSGFDVTTGKVVKNVSRVIKILTQAEAKNLTTHPTKVEAGAVWVDIT